MEKNNLKKIVIVILVLAIAGAVIYGITKKINNGQQVQDQKEMPSDIPKGGPDMGNMSDEQKAEFEQMRELMDKKMNGEELTEEEETLLEEFEKNKPEMPTGQGGPGGNFGGSKEVTNGTSANTINENQTYTDKTYTSNGDDENALRIDGAEVLLEGVSIEKLAGKTSNTENGDFYGQNAGLLALNGAQVTINNSNVKTTAQNGNGIFSYGEKTVVTINDSTIVTMKNNSGGIQTTGGGTTYANNLTVTTSGNSSAAIRSDRGGGTVVVDGGKYVSNGSGSPAIYSTADITVKNAVLEATGSEAVVVEGKNSVTLENVSLTGSMGKNYKGDDTENIHNIMIYQSMSGDAEVGHSSFDMKNGSIVSKKGDMFYVTNTSCTISLENVDLELSNENLFVISGNSNNRGWGTAGKNGGKVVAVAKNQELKGLIVVDEISSLDLTMSEKTTFKGAINKDKNNGNVSVKIDSSSSWTLTADSHVSELDAEKESIDTNGYKLYVNGKVWNG